MIGDGGLIEIQIAEKLPRLRAPDLDNLVLALREKRGEVIKGAMLSGRHGTIYSAAAGKRFVT